ncbi:MAG: hypothetical protein AAF493_24240 [Pseudomonadota bacterium]
MNELVVKLLGWVVANAPYAEPPEPPSLEYKSADAFVQETCPSGINCAAGAYYLDGSNAIVLHESFENSTEVQHRGLVVHELVHYLQDISGKFEGGKTCDMWLAREREAFAVQLKFLFRETGDVFFLYRTPSLTRKQCEQFEIPAK